MVTAESKQKKSQVILFFAFSVLTGTLSLLYYIVRGHGIYLVADDFNVQQFPFMLAMRRAIAHGLDTWSWDLDLGTSTIQGYSFFGLGSPFTWVCFLLPAAFVPYAIGLLYIAKYVTACYTSLAYLRRFTREDGIAMPGAFLYAFSGFQSSNIMFHHFHDVVAFFPLMLLGVEKIAAPADETQRRRAGIFFALAVFLNCIVNYIFFIQDTIILILYFLVRFRWRNALRRMWKCIWRCLRYGTLGVLMAAVLFLPSIYYIRGNPRTENGLLRIPLFYRPRDYLFLLKGCLLPGEAMIDHSCIELHRCHSTSCYLPFVGLIFVIAYLLKNRDWLFRMLLLCIICSLSPLLNAGFMLFTVAYQRWWLFPVLMMALATVRVLEDREAYPVKAGVWIQTILLMLFTIAVHVMKDEEGNSLIYHRTRLYGMLLLVLLSGVAAYALAKREKSPRNTMLFLCAICTISVVTTLQAQHNYRGGDPIPTEQYLQIYAAAKKLPEGEDAYRYRNSSNVLILTSGARNTTGMDSYSSTSANVLLETDDVFDCYIKDHTMNKNKIAGLPELLGGKYRLEGAMMRFEFVPEPLKGKGETVDTFTAGGIPCAVKALPACPIGYGVSHYITEDALRSLPAERRGIALLTAAMVKEEDRESVRELAEERTAEDIVRLIEADPQHTAGDALFVNRAIGTLTADNSVHAVSAFEKDDHGFSCRTDVAEEQLVFFSIPDDEGWTIRIDGEAVRPLDSAGMILLRVPAGNHRITGTYRTPWYLPGLALSVGAWLLFLRRCAVCFDFRNVLK